MLGGVDFATATYLVGVVVMTVIGTTAVVASVGSYRAEVRERRRAVETVGEIESAIVPEELRRVPGSTSVTYYPHVEYTYRFDGTDYTSTPVFPGPNWDGQFHTTGRYRWAKRTVKRFTSGERTTVYLDPERPARSFLADERTYKQVLVLAFIGLLAFVGAGLTVHLVL